MPQAKSALSRPTSTAHLSRHGHNLSHYFRFTSSVGHYLPVMQDFLSPNEKIKLDMSLFSRTLAPLSAPAQTTIDEYLEVYFVPMGRLSLVSESLLTKVDDLKTTGMTSFAVETISDFNPLPFLENDEYGIFGVNQDLNYSPRFDYVTAGAYRLLDMLSISPDAYFNKDLTFDQFTPSESYCPTSLNYLFIFAYQAIYQDINRLTQWEKFERRVTNYDAWYNEGSFDLTATSLEPHNLFRLRYRAYERDYFRALEPSPIYIDNQTITLTTENNLAGTYLDQAQVNLANNLAQHPDPQADFTQIGGSYPTGTSRSFIGVEEIRRMFAVDKLVRAIGMNAKHYDDQILARFGVSVPRDWRHEIQKIGEFHGTINIGEVIATSDGQAGNLSNKLGDIAGKGYGKGSSSSISFEAPCHGVIMVLYSSAPRICYIEGINKFNTLSDFYDIPQPELDELGLEPMFGYEGFAGSTVNVTPTTRVGWHPRYMWAKSKPNRATRVFRNDYLRRTINGVHDDWTIARHPWDYYASTNAFENVVNFLVSPHDVDNLFLSQYYSPDFTTLEQTAEESTTLANAVYGSDPFEHEIYFQYYKTSWMSPLGVPSL